MAKKQKNTSLFVKIALGVIVSLGIIGVLALLVYGSNIAVLSPKGEIASKERELMIVATLLGLIVIVPVFVMLFFIAWKYREGNTRPKKYSPDWDSNRVAEGLWWGIPLVIISILGVIAWQSSHSLDPYKALDSSVKPLKVQVVALQWRWLFLYPDQGVASMNEVNFPVNTPVDFEITADAPMNSFWIPNLGGQVYAMTGMSTQLHLQADTLGKYDGRSANISGEGFADMQFSANVTTNGDFKQWVEKTKHESNSLATDSYAKLAEPSHEKSTSGYILKQPNLYDTIVMKYMGSH